MAQFEEASGYCINCKKQVLIRRKKTSHLLHLILTLLTAGFWLIVWILAAITTDSWRCSQCGSKEVSPIKSREGAIPKWLLILSVVCILVILFTWAVSLWPNGTEEEKEVSPVRQTLKKEEQVPNVSEFKEKKTNTESKQVTDEPKISIKDYDIEIYRVRVDELSFDKIAVLLKNDGNVQGEINSLILSSGNTKIQDSPRPLVHALSPGEEKWCSLPTDFYPSLQKMIGIEQMKATISVISSSGDVLTKKDIIIPIPTVRIGETIPQVGVYQENKGISLTLLSCKETDIGVNGSYNNGYHTFTPKSNMKFIIVSYRFRNNASRPRSIPSFRVGEIATKKGYIYEEMTNLIRNSGGYKKLLPEESIKGCIVFEIPKNEIPVEASIYGLPALIKFEPSK